MTADERDLTPPGVFTMFPLEPLPADLLSGRNGLQRNLDRMAERVREEGIAEFMATPEAQAAQESTPDTLTLTNIRSAVAELETAAIPKVGDEYVVEAHERHRPEQVQARGRWRRRKQVFRKFAAELGWPECMKVAHDDQIVGAVLQAGLRLRDWRRFERSGRRSREHRRVERDWRRLRRRIQRKAVNSKDPPF
jgi:hypothetical protein